MADELQLHRDMDKAAKAEAMVADPIYVETLQALKDETVEAWRNSEPRDTTAREMAWHQLKAMDRMQKRFEEMIANGKLAAAEVKQKSEREAATQARQDRMRGRA